MKKADQLKAAVTREARDLIERRKHTPESSAPGHYLLDEISTNYEYKILKEDLRLLKSHIDDLRNFDMKVSDLHLAKVEVMEVRINTLKGYISRTSKVNYGIRKAVEKRHKEMLEAE